MCDYMKWEGYSSCILRCVYDDVMMLGGCFKNVLGMLGGCFRVVLTMFGGCFRDDLEMLMF